MADSTVKQGEIVSIDEKQIKQHLGDIVRDSVQETLNAMLDAEADKLCNAGRYERSEQSKDTRAGHMNASFTRQVGR